MTTATHEQLTQYRFRDARDGEGAVLMAVTDEHGRTIESSLHALDPTAYSEARVRLAAPAEVEGDKLFSITQDLVVSNRAWALICNLSDTPHIHPVRLSVMLNRKEVVAEAWWLVPRMSYDALHPRLARYRMNRGMNTISRVDHWALEASRVPPIDLWYEEHGRWFASEKLRQAWTSEGLTGADFAEVAVG